MFSSSLENKTSNTTVDTYIYIYIMHVTFRKSSNRDVEQMTTGRHQWGCNYNEYLRVIYCNHCVQYFGTDSFGGNYEALATCQFVGRTWIQTNNCLQQTYIFLFIDGTLIFHVNHWNTSFGNRTYLNDDINNETVRSQCQPKVPFFSART